MALMEPVVRGAWERTRKAATLSPKKRWLPVTALEFVGCDSCRMTLAEFHSYPEDGKQIEFFDSEAGLAWMVREPVGLPHADACVILAMLVDRIAMVRGSPIQCRGSANLYLLDAESRQVRTMQPDQMVYLRPDRSERRLEFLPVGEHEYPDVVLEVDHTTDVRRGKLKLYEEWGFPELWVESPNAFSPHRPRGLRPGLRIYVLEGARYRESGESRVFRGWRAEEIHRALNEPVRSAETVAVLERVGRVLGEREGTTPDDDPLLGAHRAAGRAVGHAEGRLRVVRALLERRGIAVPSDFPAGLAPDDRDTLRSRSEDRLVNAALKATSYSDFLARLR